MSKSQEELKEDLQRTLETYSDVIKTYFAPTARIAIIVHTPNRTDSDVFYGDATPLDIVAVLKSLQPTNEEPNNEDNT